MGRSGIGIRGVGSNSEQSQVALAGPNPEHMHDVFLATNYPKVVENFDISIAEEKEEVPMKDVEMDENHDIEVLQ
ncbi:hypothetical protein Tco_0790773 [Tanacetum coccineum]